MPLLLSLPDRWQDILKHVSKREFEELMCADQLTRERHKRKAFLNFSEFHFALTLKLQKANNIWTLLQMQLMSSWRATEVPFFCTFSKLTLCCSSCFTALKRRRRFLSHPPTDMSGALETATCGRSTRPLEWVIAYGWRTEWCDSVHVKTVVFLAASDHSKHKVWPHLANITMSPVTVHICSQWPDFLNILSFLKFHFSCLFVWIQILIEVVISPKLKHCCLNLVAKCSTFGCIQC